MTNTAKKTLQWSAFLGGVTWYWINSRRRARMLAQGNPHTPATVFHLMWDDVQMLNPLPRRISA